MRYNTGNPLNSSEPKDLFDNAGNLDLASNDLVSDTWIDRFGRPRKTLSALEREFQDAVNQLGFLPPVPYVAGISITSTRQTVEYQIPGQDGSFIYAPLASAIPFVTSGTFETDKFWLLAGITDIELQEAFAARDIVRGQAAYSVEQMMDLVPRPHIRPTPEFMIALMTGTVKIAFGGDSITAGSDLYYSNSYVQNFTQMLKQRWPWINWVVVNYAIGGRGAANLADPGYTPEAGGYNFPVNKGLGDINTINRQYWPNGSTSGKAWRDHIKDEAPDVIVWPFGMNDGTDVNSFAAAYASFHAYSQTWTKKPWFILSSCYLPTNQVIDGNPAWRDIQKGQQEIADWVRHRAIQEGFPLIDVNSTFRMLRDGVRREYAHFNFEKDFRFWGNADKWSTEGTLPTLSSGVLSFSTPAIAVRKIEARDIDSSGSWARTETGSVPKFEYRCRSASDLSGYTVQIVFSLNQIYLYHGSTQVVAAAISAFSIGDAPNVRVKATGSRHEVWVDETKVIDTVHGGNYYAGYIMVGSGGGSTAFSNMVLTYAPEDVVAPQYFDEVALLGTPPFGDIYVNPDSTGGNAINHPSTRGSFLFYVSSMKRMLDEFGKAIFDRPVTLFKGPDNTEITSDVLPDLSVFPDSSITITVGNFCTAIVTVAIGHTNPGPEVGVIELTVNGGAYNSWWLPRTDITEGAVPNATMRLFSTTVPVGLAPGTWTFSWRWGSRSGQPEMTSGGAGGATRTFSVTVLPS